jgi:hypothetical protein
VATHRRHFQGAFDVFLALDLNVKQRPFTLKLTLNLNVKIYQ